MKDYRLYEVMDFVEDGDFIRWAYKNNAEDNLFWNEWLSKNPEKLLAVTEARSIVEASEIKSLPVPAEEEIDEQVINVLNAIRVEKKMTGHKSSGRKRWLLAAACVMLLAGVYVTAYYYNTKSEVSDSYTYKQQTGAKKLIEQVNTSGKSLNISLPDGSTVVLSTNSRISYAIGLNDSMTRDVYLSGEAFFEVKKNPQKPFRVFTNEIVTKVLGTSFTVRSFERDKTIKVIVRTGKVNVYSQANKSSKNETANSRKFEGIVLTPNQQITYIKQDKKFEKELLEKPQIIAPEIIPQSMVFTDAKLLDVLELLKKAYGINIMYDADILKGCTITADLTDESLYRKLDLICAAIDARYEVIDSEIFIEATACK